jgi:MFS family permease
MLGMEAVPAILFLWVLFYIPESPRWLILRHKESHALTILNRIYGTKNEAERELNIIKGVTATKGESEWRYLFQPVIFKVVLIGLSLAMLGQFMGINAVMYYGPTIFHENGLSDGDSLFYQVLVGLVNVLATVLALLIIDKVGRKKLVYFGVSSIFLSLLAIAFYFEYGKTFAIPSVTRTLPFLHILLRHLYLCGNMGITV